MACIATNAGTKYTVDNAISGSTDVRQLLLKGTLPTDEEIRDVDNVAALLAITGVDEITVSGYARADLAGVAVAVSDTTNRVTLSATAPAYGDLAAGETIVAAVNYIFNASDASAVVLNVDKFETDPQAPLATNGEAVTGPAFEFRYNIA